MARRRRTARSAIVDHDGVRRAELFVDAREAGVDVSTLRSALHRVDRHPAVLRPSAGPQVSVVVDGDALRLYLGDAEIEETHDGDEFIELAVVDGVHVHVIDREGGADLRRVPPADLDDSIARRLVVGGVVPAFRVDVL